MTCDFCNEDHPGGVPDSMTSAGHPFLATHSRLGGFGYKVAGRYESLTDAEVRAAKNNGWRRRDRGDVGSVLTAGVHNEPTNGKVGQ